MTAVYAGQRALLRCRRHAAAVNRQGEIPVGSTAGKAHTMARSDSALRYVACVAAVAVQVWAKPACRDPFLQPFAVDSIWNTAIGSGAVYAPANIYNESVGHDRGPPTNFHNDQDWIVRASASDPLTPWINDAGQFPGLCTAAASAGREAAPPIRFPGVCVFVRVRAARFALLLIPYRTLISPRGEQPRL